MQLNADQIRIVNNKPNGHVLVKGVAGSGKTTVAVSKMSVLANYYMNENDIILFVTYNKTLIEYTKYLMDHTDIQQNLFYEFNPDKQLSIKTIDSIITGYAGKIKPFRRLADAKQARNCMLKAIGIVKKNYPKLELIEEKNYQFLNEEIDWLKSCSYIERETYLNVDRIGRMSRGENRYRLLKNSEERNAIFDVYLCYEEIMDKLGVVDYKTNAIRVLEAMQNGSIIPQAYRHIIVDESQDLTRVQLEIIKHLYQDKEENASIMFIADVAQSIYTQSWLSGQSFKSIGFDMSGKSNILSKNYRTTYEIAQVAYSLIENDEPIKQNDIFVHPVAIDRHGDAPCYKHYNTVQEEAEGIASRILQLVRQYELKDIVIVAATRGYLDNIKGILLEKGIAAEIFNKSKIDFDEDVVRMYTLHSVKGLEFPVLFIAGINEGILPYSEEEISIGRRLLYVGMTRAKNELYLSSSGQESVYISEMNTQLLRSQESELSGLYKVNISEYMFQEKIQNPHSAEEVVRQWFLRELVTKLNYPAECLDIEYPVQLFSKKGYIDIVVFQNKNGRQVPYIMVEAKQPGEDIDAAMKQLKSYAACCPEAEYLGVTDGRTVQIERICNQSFESIKCLPVYQESMCNIYETYEYTNWETKRHFGYEINIEDKGEIIVKDIATKEVLDCDSYQTVNVIGKVAAGVLKYANTETIGAFSLPEEFVSGKHEVFLLQVSGDSMINFQIFDGDYVLIRKQNYARNSDIVVAGRRGENEVTLKQYCNFGGNIGLMPGNPEYAPIMMPESEVFVNGVLVGILHRREEKSVL